MKTINYKEINGTSYHQETDEKVCRVLENIRNSNSRIRLYYGDTETGRDWGDDLDVTGTIGRSMGPKKVPILLYNSRSMGGVAILDHCIIRIKYANKKFGDDIYRHPKYHKVLDNEQ